MNPMETVKSFYETIESDLQNLIEYLPALIPSDDDDAQILKIAWDMLKTIKKELEDPISLERVDDTIDVDKLVESWDRGDRDKVAYINPNDVFTEYVKVLEEFGLDEYT